MANPDNLAEMLKSLEFSVNNKDVKNMRMGLENTGFGMFYKPYQVEAINYLLSRGQEGANSRMVWVAVNKKLPLPISRASIIISLNMMVNDGVLKFTEVTGKGGHHRVYTTYTSESGYKEYLARIVIEKLLMEYPDETKKVISQL